MRFHRSRGWEIPASETTPESIFLNRRTFMAGVGAIAGSATFTGRGFAEDADPSAALYPAKRNETFTLDREITPEKINLNYNNFYEFSTDKHLSAAGLKTRPWSVKIDGLVEKEQTFAIDDLI